MVKANELRIGNYIKVGGSTLDTYQTYKPIKVCPFLIQEILEENEERGNDYILSVFQPIKLTPEILEKCGFAKYDSTMQIDYGRNVWWERKGDELWLVTESGYHILKVEYLHLFQNVHFYLTGEEISIDL